MLKNKTTVISLLGTAIFFTFYIVPNFYIYLIVHPYLLDIKLAISGINLFVIFTLIFSLLEINSPDILKKKPRKVKFFLVVCFLAYITFSAVFAVSAEKKEFEKYGIKKQATILSKIEKGFEIKFESETNDSVNTRLKPLSSYMEALERYKSVPIIYSSRNPLVVSLDSKAFGEIEKSNKNINK